MGKETVAHRNMVHGMREFLGLRGHLFTGSVCAAIAAKELGIPFDVVRVHNWEHGFQGRVSRAGRAYRENDFDAPRHSATRFGNYPRRVSRETWFEFAGHWQMLYEEIPSTLIPDAFCISEDLDSIDVYEAVVTSDVPMVRYGLLADWLLPVWLLRLHVVAHGELVRVYDGYEMFQEHYLPVMGSELDPYYALLDRPRRHKAGARGL